MLCYELARSIDDRLADLLLKLLFGPDGGLMADASGEAGPGI